MTTREKRNTTQPGLGKVSEDSRRTAVRERGSDDERVASESSGPPISAPPISGAPPSARHTRGLESVAARAADGPRPIETRPVNTKALAAADRISIPSADGRPVDRRAPTMREESSPPRVESPRSPPVDTQRPGRPLRPIEGRPVDSSRPGKTPSSKPPARRSVSTRPPAVSPSRPARPGRASIRVDDVGAAVKSGADAIGMAGRQVPKIIRSKAEIAAAPIDHRAGFLLAHIDGVTSVQGLVDIAGMPENEVHEILERLRRLGIVAIR